MNWASLFLRLGLGFMFTAHGLQKVFGLFGGPGIGGFSKMLSGLGFIPVAFWAYLAGSTELVGGLCLIVGFLTTLFSFMLLILIMVAALKVHMAGGFFLATGGIEYTFVIAFALAALIILGPGRFSIYEKF